MHHKEWREYPARKQEIVTKITCDLCGNEIKDTSYTYEKDEITIQRQKGEHYPSGGQGTYYELDMCPNCWENKFTPWVREQKADFRERDYDF